MLGLVYGKSGSLEQAETALKKAYEQGGSEAADAHVYLAGIYDRREKYLEASRELELYLKEAKGLKNRTQIKEMIAKLKAKVRSKKAISVNSNTRASGNERGRDKCAASVWVSPEPTLTSLEI